MLHIERYMNSDEVDFYTLDPLLFIVRYCLHPLLIVILCLSKFNMTNFKS